MSLQWIAIAGFLYLEMFIALLFVIPFISASRWSKIFKSRMIKTFSNYSTLYFNFLLIILALLFLDAIREVIKYNKMEYKIGSGHVHDSEATILMRLFRAQRNLYVSGFSLFMWFVLRRMVVLITNVAQLEASSAAALKQAQSASDAAKAMLKNTDVTDNKPKSGEELKEKLKTATDKLVFSEKEINRLELDLETLKKQYVNHNKAYDDLLAEHGNLQKKLAVLQNKNDNKKDD